MTHRLAIIIPAYKATFLPAALDSKRCSYLVHLLWEEKLPSETSS